MGDDGFEQLIYDASRGQHEYLSHTADVKIHAWGDSLGYAFCAGAVGMFGYLTELDCVRVDAHIKPVVVHVHGHDAQSLLFSFLDECLFIFSTELLVVRQIVLTDFRCADHEPDGQEGSQAFSVRAVLYGEKWDSKKHPAGCEIKAITFNEMEIYRTNGDTPAWHVEFVVDI
ncbi:Protein archease-like [Porphyridium purpureum]|uniref:Protein archease-like n=1 Tax=Porphyridium purpureum TaxID=35688 RepID=A0A5J4YT28_PORPP|nr:Protein archease-like [Porphyridium purpureum]|eukprot:POR8279..scf229_5